MTDMTEILRRARQRISDLADTMNPGEAAAAMRAAVPLVADMTRWSNLPVNKLSPKPAMGEDAVGRFAMTAFCAGIEAPLALQQSGFVGRRLEATLEVVARDYDEREDMEAVYVDHAVKKIAAGRTTPANVPERVADRLLDAAMPAAQNDAKAGAALLASLLAGQHQALADKALVALTKGLDATRAKAFHDALATSARDWLMARLFERDPLPA